MVPAENDLRKAGTIWMLNLDEPVVVVKPKVQAEFCRVDLESVQALNSVIDSKALAEFVKRLRSGRQCYAAYVDGQLAAYGWVSLETEEIGELNLRVGLLAGEAYVWDCATLPAYREKHLYSALLAYILGELRSQELCRVWIGADLDNVASQKGMARAGFQYVADLVMERVLAVRQVSVTGEPGIPESIVDEARRVFLNDRHKVSPGTVSSMKKG